MIPIRDNQLGRNSPVVTWTLIGLNCFVFLWDRQWHVLGPSVVFADCGMRPEEVVGVFRQGTGTFPLVTMFTCLFLHANLVHLIGNMLFLLTFGPGIEQALRPPRFALYYLFWGLVASGTHVIVYPSSAVPIVGASGAIGGVLGAYFLLFPTNKIEILIPFVFIPLVVSAWALLAMWFAWQILVPQQGVANWAHVGGFMAGMATVLVMGGRERVLRGREQEFEYEHDFD
jgi:membrane associated rhomboid family serine protease